MGLNWTPSRFHDPGDNNRPHHLPPLPSLPGHDSKDGSHEDKVAANLDKFSNRKQFNGLNNLHDLADFVFDSYSPKDRKGNRTDNSPRAKIVVYKSQKVDDHGRPIYVINITGTESFADQTNTMERWIPAGTGEVTDYEEQVLESIKDAIAQGIIPPDAVIDLTGHSLGGIIGNNISGHNNGVIDSADNRIHIPIRKVVAYGAPEPAVNCPNVQYIEIGTVADPVASLNTWNLGGQGRHPENVTHVMADVPLNELFDAGGHNAYKKENGNSLVNQSTRDYDLDYGELKLVAAYTNPNHKSKEELYNDNLAALDKHLNATQFYNELVQFGDYSVQVVQDAGEAGRDFTDLGLYIADFTQGDVQAFQRAGGKLEELFQDLNELGNDSLHGFQNFMNAAGIEIHDIGILGELLFNEAPFIVTNVPVILFNATNDKVQQFVGAVGQWLGERETDVEHAAEDTIEKGQEIWNAGINWLGENIPHPW